MVKPERCFLIDMAVTERANSHLGWRACLERGFRCSTACATSELIPSKNERTLAGQLVQRVAGATWRVCRP